MVFIPFARYSGRTLVATRTVEPSRSCSRVMKPVFILRILGIQEVMVAMTLAFV